MRAPVEERGLPAEVRVTPWSSPGVLGAELQPLLSLPPRPPRPACCGCHPPRPAPAPTRLRASESPPRFLQELPPERLSAGSY